MCIVYTQLFSTGFQQLFVMIFRILKLILKWAYRSHIYIRNFNPHNFISSSIKLFWKSKQMFLLVRSNCSLKVLRAIYKYRRAQNRNISYCLNLYKCMYRNICWEGESKSEIVRCAYTLYLCIHQTERIKWAWLKLIFIFRPNQLNYCWNWLNLPPLVFNHFPLEWPIDCMKEIIKIRNWDTRM